MDGQRRRPERAQLRAHFVAALGDFRPRLACDRADLAAHGIVGLRAELRAIGVERGRVGAALRVDRRAFFGVEGGELLHQRFARGFVQREIRKARFDGQSLRGVLLGQPQREVGFGLLKLFGLGLKLLRRLDLELARDGRARRVVGSDDALLVGHEVLIRGGGRLLGLLGRGRAHLLRVELTAAAHAGRRKRRGNGLLLAGRVVALLLRENFIGAQLRVAQLAVEFLRFARDLRAR